MDEQHTSAERNDDEKIKTERALHMLSWYLPDVARFLRISQNELDARIVQYKLVKPVPRQIRSYRAMSGED